MKQPETYARDAVIVARRGTHIFKKPRATTSNF